MNVVASGRIDLRPMVTNRFALDQIEQSAGITSAHAEQSAQSSAHLNSEAIRLNRLVDELSALMHGSQS